MTSVGGSPESLKPVRFGWRRIVAWLQAKCAGDELKKLASAEQLSLMEQLSLLEDLTNQESIALMHVHIDNRCKALGRALGLQLRKGIKAEDTDEFQELSRFKEYLLANQNDPKVGSKYTALLEHLNTKVVKAARL
jgi:hypothetical protein